MLAVIDIHIVGGDPWWQGLVGPVLLAGTAIIAAWIAASTANKRQAEQLRHDRELQAGQLAYDREQRNRQHVRSAVDDAVCSLDAAMRTGFEYEARVLVDAEGRAGLRGTAEDEGVDFVERTRAMTSLEERLTELSSASQAARDSAIDLISENLRLTLRLGSDHSIVKSHMAIHDAFTARIDLLQPMQRREVTEEDRKEVQSQSTANAVIVSSFFDDCRNWFAEA